MTFTRLWPVFTTLLYLLNIAIAVYSSIMLISSKRDPVKTLSWVMVMMMLPYIGIILYFFFGRNFRKGEYPAGGEAPPQARGAEYPQRLQPALGQ